MRGWRIWQRDSEATGEAIRPVGTAILVPGNHFAHACFRSFGFEGEDLLTVATPERSSRHGEVLVLDDDLAMLKILKGILESAGRTYHAVDDAEAALALISRREEIRVVLSDILMPGMTGLQFVDRLLALPLNRPAPRVLVLTGHPSLETAISALRLGVCDFLTKPIEPAKLIETVDRVMERAESDQLRGNPMCRELERIIERSQALIEGLQQLASAGPGRPDTRPDAARQSTEASAAPEPLSDTLILKAVDDLRKLRSRYDSQGLDELGWELLLEIARSERKRQRLSVSGLMVSIPGASATTILRRINELAARGYIERTADPKDARRNFVSLSTTARELVAEFLVQANEVLAELRRGGSPQRASELPAGSRARPAPAR